jgi:hypothetical protein
MKSEAGDAVAELTGVQEENRRLRAENEQLRASAGLQSPEIESLVQERIRLSEGQLDRKTALEAVKQQLAWDKHPTNPSAKKD